MIKFLYRINKNYDNIPEIKRFFTFLALAMPAIIMVGIPPLAVSGWIWFMVMICVRMPYIEGWLNSGKVDSE